MVQVQLKDYGQGIWRALLLPVSLLAAQTVAKAARTLNLADQVQVAPTRPSGRALDLHV
jgi:hypothetical protein